MGSCCFTSKVNDDEILPLNKPNPEVVEETGPITIPSFEGKMKISIESIKVDNPENFLSSWDQVILSRSFDSKKKM